ncbi:thioredoxin family protein [Effusibacillus consociatus]|uniref:Thioredoxin family protein n=1 Tax=Effusibacillus consociatus TaxID=1117041 RepID=A0ABV9Q113_9BACL
MGPVVEKLEREYPNVNFVYVDSDDQPALPQRYGVLGLPTLILFKQGKPLDPLVGAQPETNIRTYIEK